MKPIKNVSLVLTDTNSKFKQKCVLQYSVKMAKFSSELHKNVSVLLTLHTSIIIPATNANKTIILEMANVSHVGKDLSTICQPEHVNATKATDISPKVPTQQLV